MVRPVTFAEEICGFFGVVSAISFSLNESRGSVSKLWSEICSVRRSEWASPAPSSFSAKKRRGAPRFCIEFVEIPCDLGGLSEDGLRLREFRAFRFNLLSIEMALRSPA